MAVDINLNNVQQEPIVVSASQTADLNKYYINVASATYTDPTPTEGKGFTVFVRNGTATVGGSAYAVAGTTIYRVYHSGAWANYTHVSTTTANTWDLLQTFTNGVKSTLFTNDDGEFKLTKTIAGSILMWTNGQDFRFSATVGGAPSVELDKTTGKLKLLDETASTVVVLDSNKGMTGETKGTAFNKNFGTTAGTVCEGNDSRLSKNITVASTVTTAGHTGNTTETILGTPLTIVAGTFIANDGLVVNLMGNTLGTAGTKTYNLYLNTVANLTGSPILIGRLATGSVAVGVRFIRNYEVESTSLIKGNVAGTGNQPHDYIIAATYSTFAPDLTVTQYLIVTGTLTNSGDTINLQSLRINRNRV